MTIQEIIDEFREKFDDGIDPAEWYCDWKDEDIDEWFKETITAYGESERKKQREIDAEIAETLVDDANKTADYDNTLAIVPTRILNQKD